MEATIDNLAPVLGSGCSSTACIIEERAFYNCRDLISIEVGESVVAIGVEAFHGCTSLVNVTLPSSLTTVHSRAFGRCTSLHSIMLPSDLKDLEDEVFLDCTSLTALELPSGITSIGMSLCENCTALATVTITANVTSVPQAAFRGCTSLATLVLPDSLTLIADHAFDSCSSLDNVIVPSKVLSLGAYAFHSCLAMTRILLPEGLLHLRDYAFAGSSNLVSIKLPSTLVSLGVSAFAYSALHNISIPGGIEEIRTDTFSRCANLATVVFQLPSSVSTIGTRAFAGCSSLASIWLPPNVTTVAANAFIDTALMPLPPPLPPPNSPQPPNAPPQPPSTFAPPSMLAASPPSPLVDTLASALAAASEAKSAAASDDADDSNSDVATAAASRAIDDAREALVSAVTTDGLGASASGGIRAGAGAAQSDGAQIGAVATIELAPSVAAFAGAVLGVASTALSVTRSRVVGDAALLLTSEVASAIHQTILASTPLVDGDGGQPIAASSVRTSGMLLNVLSAQQPVQAALELSREERTASSPPSLPTTPLDLSMSLQETSLPHSLSAVASLAPGVVYECGGLSVAFIGSDPRGGATDDALSHYFSGVVSVRRLGCSNEANGDRKRRLSHRVSPRGERLQQHGAGVRRWHTVHGSTSARLLSDALAGVAEQTSSASSPTAATVYAFNTTLPVQGGGNCTPSPYSSLVLGLTAKGDSECLGGVCCGGVCSCEPGFFGRYCEVHVDCGQWSPNRSAWDNRTCALVGSAELSSSSSVATTAPERRSWANCSCSVHEGDFTLRAGELTHRWLPHSNLQLNEENLRILSTSLKTGPSAYLLLVMLLLAWALASYAAFHFDCRHVYLRDIPTWMWAPPTYSYRWRFMHHMRRKHSVWRFFCVVPGISPLTRLQLVTSLMVQLLLAFCTIVLWYGAPSCFVEQEIMAALISTTISIAASSLGRLLFRVSNRCSWDGEKQDKLRRKLLKRQKTRRPKNMRESITCVRDSIVTVVDGSFAGSMVDLKGIRPSMAHPPPPPPTMERSPQRPSTLSHAQRPSQATGHPARASQSRQGNGIERQLRTSYARKSQGRWSQARGSEARGSMLPPLAIRRRTAGSASYPAFDPFEHRATSTAGLSGLERLTLAQEPPSAIVLSPEIVEEEEGPEEREEQVEDREEETKDEEQKEAKEACKQAKRWTLSSTAKWFGGSVSVAGAAVATCATSDTASIAEEIPSAVELDESAAKLVRVATDAGATVATMARAATDAALASLPPSPPSSPRPPSALAPVSPRAAAKPGEHDHCLDDGLEISLAVRKEQARRGGVRDRMIGVWLPSDRLHRVQGDWALIVEDEGTTESKVLIPVHSLGVSSIPQLPFGLRWCCFHGARRCMPHRLGELLGVVDNDGAAENVVLVRIAPEDVPRGFRVRRLTAGVLRPGGPLAATSPWGRCSALKLFAWFYNIIMLIYGTTFLLFVSIVVFGEAQLSWSAAVIGTFFLSLAFTFMVSDLVVAAVVACLPFKAEHSRMPIRFCLDFLCDIVFD